MYEFNFEDTELTFSHKNLSIIFFSSNKGKYVLYSFKYLFKLVAVTVCFVNLEDGEDLFISAGHAHFTT